MGFARRIKPVVFSECGLFYIGFHSLSLTALKQKH